jgi:hypothetical protein
MRRYKSIAVAMATKSTTLTASARRISNSVNPSRLCRRGIDFAGFRMTRMAKFRQFCPAD